MHFEKRWSYVLLFLAALLILGGCGAPDSAKPNVTPTLDVSVLLRPIDQEVRAFFARRSGPQDVTNADMKALKKHIFRKYRENLRQIVL